MEIKLVEWRPLHGFENTYIISNTGVVKSLAQTHIRHGRRHTVSERIISSRIDKRSKYPVVKLCSGKKCGSKFLHRLLAQTFIENPENKCCVNHKNGIKTDYSLDNLEWTTHAENSKHAVDTGLSKPVVPLMKKVVDNCNNVEYPSIKAASDGLGISYKTLYKRLQAPDNELDCVKLAA